MAKKTKAEKIAANRAAAAKYAENDHSNKADTHARTASSKAVDRKSRGLPPKGAAPTSSKRPPVKPKAPAKSSKPKARPKVNPGTAKAPPKKGTVKMTKPGGSTADVRYADQAKRAPTPAAKPQRKGDPKPQKKAAGSTAGTRYADQADRGSKSVSSKRPTPRPATSAPATSKRPTKRPSEGERKAAAETGRGRSNVAGEATRRSGDAAKAAKRARPDPAGRGRSSNDTEGLRNEFRREGDNKMKARRAARAAKRAAARK